MIIKAFRTHHYAQLGATAYHCNMKTIYFDFTFGVFEIGKLCRAVKFPFKSGAQIRWSPCKKLQLHVEISVGLPNTKNRLLKKGFVPKSTFRLNRKHLSALHLRFSGTAKRLQNDYILRLH